MGSRHERQTCYRCRTLGPAGVESGEVLRSFFPDDTAAYDAVMDRDEKRFLAAFTFGEQGVIDKLGMYDAESAELLHVISKDDYALWRLRAHRQSNRFAAGGEHETYLWSLTDSGLIHQFPGTPGPFSTDGRVPATLLRRPRTTLLWDAQDGRYLGGVDTEIVGFHPGGALAFTQDHRTALGVLDLQTGRTVAEGSTDDGGLSRSSRRRGHSSRIMPCSPRKWDCPLRPVAEWFTFGDEWLAVTADGHVAGSEQALRRVTWRTRHPDDGPRVEVDAERTARRHRPRQVAEALTRALPEAEHGTGPIWEQAETFHVEPRETRSPHAGARAMRERAVEQLKAAGAELRINRHDDVTFVHLERRAVDDELLHMLPWLQSIDRLYLAATGVTEEQLRPVGLMGRVERAPPP